MNFIWLNPDQFNTLGPAHILVVDIGAQGAHAQLGVSLVVVFHLDPCLG